MIIFKIASFIYTFVSLKSSAPKRSHPNKAWSRNSEESLKVNPTDSFKIKVDFSGLVKVKKLQMSH